MQPRETERRPLSRCAEARRLLSAFAENELSAEERRRVLGHIEICSACSREAADYEAALAVFASACPAEAPPDLFASVSARIDRIEARRRRFSSTLRWAATAACLLLVVGAGAVTARYLSLSASQNSAPPRTAAVEEGQLDAPKTGNGREDPFVADASPNPGKLPPKRNVPPPASFEDVQDERGESLRSLRNRRVTSAEPLPGPWDHLPDVPEDRKPVTIEAAVDERIRLGDMVTIIRGESGYDAKGRLALIRLDASVEPLDPSEPPDKRTKALYDE